MKNISERNEKSCMSSVSATREERVLNTTDVEKLRSLLLKNRPVFERFHIPINGDDLYNLLTAAVQKEIFSRFGYPVKDIDQDAIIRGIAEYLSADYRYGKVSSVCSPEELDVSFGILMTGQPGGGKSSIIAAIRRIISMLEMRDPSAPSTEIRELCLPVFTASDIARIFTTDSEAYDRITKKYALAIDDVGTEPMELLVYGNVYSPVKELMYRRYNDSAFTIISTNLNGEEFIDKYGSRIGDRIREMFRVFRFPDKTFRG